MYRIPDIKIAKLFIGIIYTVGLVGIMNPISRDLFLTITPLNLLLSFALILVYEKQKLSLRWISIAVLIYLLSWSIEYVGVSTGILFGSYHYGDTLGLKLFGTPLIIGVNWLILLMGSASVVRKTNWHPVLKVLAASALMTLLDVLIEQVAIQTDMWSWDNNKIPFQNYVTWFVAALVLHSLWLLAYNKKGNPMAVRIFWIQWVFFAILTLYFAIW